MADDAEIRSRWLKKLAERRKFLTVARGVHDKALKSPSGPPSAWLARHTPKPPKPPAPANKQVWHPDASGCSTRPPASSSTARPKLVWHTTEGSSLPNYGRVGAALHA
jgi:hypothetical protein